MKKFMILLIIIAVGMLVAEEASEILARIDDNIYSDAQIIKSRMIIQGRRSTREIATRSWSRGSKDSFTEYLAPPREAGTKMLKLDDKLWIYEKHSDRIIQMSGHLLRQSVNGSDLSYEDFMEETEYELRYNARIMGTEMYNETECTILLLTARDEDVAYYQRKLWVDTTLYLPLKEELYGKSGTLLKRTELSDFRQIDKRWYPYKIFYKDVLNTKGKGTYIVIDEIVLDASIPESTFSKAKLRK